ncbi:hypothetical protein EVJ58_g3867 [Rhodofomes roseus]|uniref:Uncharacterized protein n=1 Tax=Rhodofomes roseus TaxID=34475 RepID=A0A4Y9YLF2_9APHY|nr:hypothetical protein EVJ58_g3867 [Rhodofomes roseus]
MPARLLPTSSASPPSSPSKSTPSTCESAKRNNFLAKFKSSAIYKVLFIPDLCDIIVRFLYDPDRPETRVSVARLARTHPKLHHTASRILWGNMDSFVPLLKLIPGYTWRKDRDERGDTRWDVEEANTTGSKSSQTVVDTVRFEHHSRYVKKFIWTDKDLTPRTLSFFVNALSSLNKPWLPAVRVFDDLSLHSVPPFALVASPNLQDLWVTATLAKEEALMALFDELLSRCRDLQHLHIREPRRTDERGLGDSKVFYPAFTNFLRKGIDGKALMGLRTLRMTVPIVWEDIVSLARLPCLEGVDVALWIDPKLPTDLERLPPGSFPSLTRLWLDLPALNAEAEHLLDSIDSVCLADISMLITDVAPDAMRVCRLFEGLTKSPFRDALTRFFFVVSSASQESIVPGSRTLASSTYTLRPLLRLRNLRCLDLGLPRITLCCDDVNALASAFPRLERIKVQQTWDGMTPVGVECLSAFSAKCPDLKHIGFDVWLGRTLCSCRVLCPDKFNYHCTVAYLMILFPGTATPELRAKYMQYLVRANAIARGSGEVVTGEGAAGEGAAGEVAAGEAAAGEVADEVAAGDAQ